MLPGTIGHVAHGKSTVVKAISGVQVNITANSLTLKRVYNLLHSHFEIVIFNGVRN